jgi:hypothetical protein
MTRGLGGVLTLPSRGLTSGAATAPIFYRFISAHWVSLLIPCRTQNRYVLIYYLDIEAVRQQ